MLIGTIPAAGAITFPTQFVPQFILIRGSAGATLVGDITGQINVNGDGVIFNLDAAGIIAMAGINQYLSAASQDLGAPATVGLVYQLAEGLVQNKNVSWTFTNADAATVQIFAWSKQKRATYYLTYLTQLCQASSGSNFDNFAYLAVPTLVAADNVTVNYNDGTSNPGMSLREMLADTAYYQNPDRIAINNINPARVSLVTIIPAASKNAYIMRYQPTKGVVDAAAIAR